MSSKKDMRREEFIIPYKTPDKDEKEGEVASTMSTTLPMVAMFTRNKMIGWASLVFAVQTWLAQTPEQAKKAGAPGWMSVGMAFLALGTNYAPLFLPPAPGTRATGTEAPPAAPPS